MPSYRTFRLQTSSNRPFQGGAQRGYYFIEIGYYFMALGDFLMDTGDYFRKSGSAGHQKLTFRTVLYEKSQGAEFQKAKKSPSRSTV